ncbi:hypothetical protein Taqua_02313 [Tepidimonas aquatica]|uniref:Uncharacterized protein n=1 Tax=Tepidimonas aquatica TaxID=247482 RepID=A0A554WC90_9BURK|nr:hypothetical protein Taqua_02313 [Tepidimonas aquatica]
MPPAAPAHTPVHLALHQQRQALFKGQFAGCDVGGRVTQSGHHAVQAQGAQLVEGLSVEHRVFLRSWHCLSGSSPARARSRANRLRPRTGRLQPLGPVLPPQTHQSQTGAVALFGVGAVLHLPAHHGGGGRADALAPGDELGWRPLQVCPVRGRHVLSSRGVRAFAPIERVGGHPLVAVQDFHGGGGDAQLHHLAHQGVGHRVVVAVELDKGAGTVARVNRPGN